MLIACSPLLFFFLFFAGHLFYSIFERRDLLATLLQTWLLGSKRMWLLLLLPLLLLLLSQHARRCEWERGERWGSETAWAPFKLLLWRVFAADNWQLTSSGFMCLLLLLFCCLLLLLLLLFLLHLLQLLLLLLLQLLLLSLGILVLVLRLLLHRRHCLLSHNKSWRVIIIYCLAVCVRGCCCCCCCCCHYQQLHTLLSNIGCCNIHLAAIPLLMSHV